MALIGQALIAIWNGISAPGREIFHEWHPREHMPERLSIPGFERGRRYVATSADIEFLTLYELASLAVISGPHYKARLNSPTPWSVEATGHFTSNIRGVCRVAASIGHADGAHVAAMRFSPAPGASERCEAHLASVTLPEVLAKPRICGAHLAITDVGASGTQTRLQATRKIEVPDWIVLIEGASDDAVAEAAAQFVGDLARHGLTDAAPITGHYQLEYGIVRTAHRPDDVA